MTMDLPEEFSFLTRLSSLERFKKEEFDLLIIGGGITGAATARDAASRGLKVALIEKRDFAWGTSSKSSKLIHGGLRYLENFEFPLVFEALAERAHLLKSAPHLVRPMRFFLPVYRGNTHHRSILNAGLYLYDFLALFRSPGFHKNLSPREFIKRIPSIKKEGLRGGFEYFDACMRDDLLVVETLRSAQKMGAVVANYVEAIEPLQKGDRVEGFRVKDIESAAGEKFSLYARRCIVCGGPWTDELGFKISSSWRRWLTPSKGIHLVFDLKKIPVPGAIVMSHPDDGRIAFVIPRTDLGDGISLVGTTDGPTPADPERAVIEKADVDYLMDLLRRYFPDIRLSYEDIISAYVGVRPLMESQPSSDPHKKEGGVALQKVSREHFIGRAPGGIVVVAGGKYTTHRTMAREIVDFTLNSWAEDAKKGHGSPYPKRVGRSRTESEVNGCMQSKALIQLREQTSKRGWVLPEALVDRYGSDAQFLMELHSSREDLKGGRAMDDPEGFPLLCEQLRFAIRTQMVIRLEDFYFRRVPLYMTRRDGGLPWAGHLAEIWAEELGVGKVEAKDEVSRLQKEMDQRNEWRKNLKQGP